MEEGKETHKDRDVIISKVQTELFLHEHSVGKLHLNGTADIGGKIYFLDSFLLQILFKAGGFHQRFHTGRPSCHRRDGSRLRQREGKDCEQCVISYYTIQYFVLSNWETSSSSNEMISVVSTFSVSR